MLKLIACLTMLVDHVGFVFFPGQLWLRIIGRIAFPLFSWYVAAGFSRTHNRARYLVRLLLWGVVSQIPFAMLFHGGTFRYPASLMRDGTNVLFTFVLALLAMWLLEMVKPHGFPARVGAWIGVGLLAYAAWLIHTDYGAYGVGMVLLFHWLGEWPGGARGQGTPDVSSNDQGMPPLPTNEDALAHGLHAGQPGHSPHWLKRVLLLAGILLWTLVCMLFMRMHPIQLYCAAAIPLIWLRLPDPKPGRWRFAFYAFYPIHLFVLLALARLV